MTAVESKDAALANVTGCFAGFFGTWLMNIGRRARLFEVLRDERGLSADELADRLGYERRYVETWCRGAFAFEFLEREGNQYRLAPHVGDIMLDSSDPAFMGGRAEFFPMLTPDFEMYPDRLGDGERYPLSARPAAVVANLAAATRADAPNMIANVIPTDPELERRLKGGARVLDVGCGAGHGLAAFVEAYPASEFVGIEIDEASLKDARRLAGDNVRVERMHVTEMPFSDEFDLAYANISLSHTYGAHPDVLRSIRAAIKPGGRLLVSDVPYPRDLDALRSPAGRLFTGVTVYVSLLGFELLTPEGLVDALESAAFEDVRIVPQPAKTRMMVLAKRS
jgi:SAM-dependent methyltransferase